MCTGNIATIVDMDEGRPWYEHPRGPPVSLFPAACRLPSFKVPIVKRLVKNPYMSHIGTRIGG